MKLYFFLALLFSTLASATELAVCDNDSPGVEQSSISPLLTRFVRPNCHTDMNLMMDSGLQAGQSSEICDNCRSRFLLEDTRAEDAPRLERARRASFSTVIYKEVQKVISATLLDLATLRNLPATGANYSNSIQACNVSNLKNSVRECPGLVGTGLTLEKLEADINNEIAQLLSPSQLNVQGLSPRPTSSNTCNISEAQTARLFAMAVEELITPEFAASIAALDPNMDRQKFEDEMRKKVTQAPADELIRHPLLGALRENPREFISFFRSLGQNHTSQDSFITQLRSKLYNAEQGTKLDRKFAQRCERAFDNLKSSVCSPSLASASPNMGSTANFERMLDGAQVVSDDEVKNKEMEDRNFNLLSFCPADNTTSLPAFDLNKIINNINEWMPTDHQLLPLSRYSHQRLSDQVGTPRERLCDSACPQEDGTVVCKMSRLLQKNSQTPEARRQFLAGETDPNVNNILRSFVGTPRDLSPEVRQVLISEGILPQENGEYATNNAPQAPQPQATAQTQQAQAAGPGSSGTSAGSTGTASTAQPAQSYSARREQYRGQQQLARTPPPAPSSLDDFDSDLGQQIDDLSNLSESQQRRLADMQDEIRRKLAPAPGQPRRPPTREQVTRATREASRRTNTRLSPASEQQYIDEIMRDFQPGSENFAAGPAPAQRNTGGAQLGDDLAGPSRAYTQKQEALAGMAGARASAGASGGSAGGPGRGPAQVPEQENTANLPTFPIDLKGRDISQNLEAALKEQLGARITNSFKLEIIGSNSQERIQYIVTKGANEQYQVSLFNDTPLARRHLQHVQEIVNRLHIEQTRNARLKDLQNFSRLPPSRT